MQIVQQKDFGIYHRDVFSGEVTMVGECDTYDQAEQAVERMYAGQIVHCGTGCDEVDIQRINGEVVRRFEVKPE